MNQDDVHTDDAAPGEEAEAIVDTIYSEDGVVLETVVDTIRHAIEGDDSQAVREALDGLHESEVGDILHALEEELRDRFVELAGDAFNFAALTEVDEAIRLGIVDNLSNDKVALAVRELDSDDAVYILEDLESEEREDILAQIPFQERIRLRRSLDYPEESAGRRMQTEFIAVPPFWSVGQTIDYIRADEDLPERFTELFTIDHRYKLAGSLALDTLLRSQRETVVGDIHEVNAHPVHAEMDQEEAAQLFERYDLLSAPVVDENDRLVGVLTIDDVVDVIQEEASEDIMRLAGVGDEELSDDIVSIAKSRIGWLAVNLATAVLASLVIGLFDATLEQMVALAILMPIVASMGGNAGTQTMTVAVRALATRDLDTYNARKIIRKELQVGLINGSAFAVLMGLVTVLWFGQPVLGVIIGIAMIVNMIFAAASGILVPIALDKLDADPAISSSVFVTTVTDVVGFFAFLGLASWWFNI
ncbi:MAG: magnesium transporter [Rhizobiaceae bacterium]|nr:magnesium transporter [Rhizobiaceae bacterium]